MTKKRASRDSGGLATGLLEHREPSGEDLVDWGASCQRRLGAGGGAGLTYTKNHEKTHQPIGHGDGTSSKTLRGLENGQRKFWRLAREKRFGDRDEEIEWGWEIRRRGSGRRTSAGDSAKSTLPGLVEGRSRRLQHHHRLSPPAASRSNYWCLTPGSRNSRMGRYARDAQCGDRAEQGLSCGRVEVGTLSLA